MVSVMLYRCILCVTLLMDLFSLSCYMFDIPKNVRIVPLMPVFLP